MNWQDQLITIYLYICKHYQNHLWVYSQRMSNYADLRFSDEEVIKRYFFGVIDKNKRTKKDLWLCRSSFARLVYSIAQLYRLCSTIE